MSPTLIDSHCHLDFDDLAGRLPEVFARMEENRVVAAVCIGVNLEDWPKVIALAESDARLFATVGVHPEYADAREATVDELVSLARHPKVIAIGECGLDYHWHEDAPEWQRARFRTHIAAARRAGLPLVVHTRDAAADTLRLLAEEGADEVGGVMHCFTENWEVASAALDLGFYISFSGIVTFKNAVQIKEVAQKAPLDRILVETDAPFLAPVPFRGKLNEPGYVLHVAEEIARLRGLTLAAVAEATTANFTRLFPGTRQGLESR
jgi:TatD DNase family protein